MGGYCKKERNMYEIPDSTIPNKDIAACLPGLPEKLLFFPFKLLGTYSFSLSYKAYVYYIPQQQILLKFKIKLVLPG